MVTPRVPSDCGVARCPKTWRIVRANARCLGACSIHGKAEADTLVSYRASPASPSLATATAYPARSSIRRASRACPALSSMIRIRTGFSKARVFTLPMVPSSSHWSLPAAPPARGLPQPVAGGFRDPPKRLGAARRPDYGPGQRLWRVLPGRAG